MKAWNIKYNQELTWSNLPYTEHTNVGQYTYTDTQGFPFLFPPPQVTKQQFSSYNPIKTAFLTVVNVPAPFLF